MKRNNSKLKTPNELFKNASTPNKQNEYIILNLDIK